MPRGYYPRRNYGGYRGYNPNMFYGHGAYKVAPKPRKVKVVKVVKVRKAKAPAQSTGRQLATSVGSRLAGTAYDLAANGLSALKGKIMGLIGSGDYEVGTLPRSNVLTNDAQIPKFVASREAITITHREYLGDLISSPTVTNGRGEFKIQAFPLNPGLPSSFPWLADIAPNFQQYRWNGIVYEYRSMSADALNSTNTALGNVTFSTDYDSSEAAFTNKQQMENTEYAVSCKPSVNMMHGIECARTQTTVSELYIRTGDPPANYDKRLYDLGVTYIATQGCQAANVNLGEIWVSYSVTFFKAVQQPRGVTNLCARYRLVPANATAAAPLMLTGATVDFDNIGLSNTGLGGVASGLTLVFPQSIPVGTVFQVTFCADGSQGTNAPPPVAGYIGCRQINSFLANSAPTFYGPNGMTAGSGTINAVSFVTTFQVTSTVLEPQLIVTAATYGTARTSIDLHVDQLNAVAYR